MQRAAGPTTARNEESADVMGEAGVPTPTVSLSSTKGVAQGRRNRGPADRGHLMIVFRSNCLLQSVDDAQGERKKSPRFWLRECVAGGIDPGAAKQEFFSNLPSSGDNHALGTLFGDKFMLFEKGILWERATGAPDGKSTGLPGLGAIDRKA